MNKPYTCGVMRLRIIILFLLPVLGTNTTSPSDPEEATPRDELQEIRTIFDQSVRQADNRESLEGILVDFTIIRSRLDIFEMRFGLQPNTVKGWEDIEKNAKALLPTFKRLSEEGLYFDRDSAKIAYSVLLELSGKAEEALEELNAVIPGGGCGNWHATVEMSLARQKSGIYERMGKYADALNAQEEAMKAIGLSLYCPSGDILYTRYAFLLSRNGHRWANTYYAK